MFCSNCGKELPNDAKFCAECGSKNGEVVNDSNNNKSINVNLNFDYKKLLEKVDHGKVLTVLSVITSVLALIIRIANHEIEVVGSFLAYDDYYAISSEGKVWMIVLAVAHALICAFFINHKKKNNPPVEKKLVWAFLPVAICLLLLISVPAPY